MNTPSATPPAIRSVRGPPAAIQIGTGRWCGSRAGRSAPTSTASPSSSARISRVDASSSFTRAGFRPASLTAVSPMPQPRSVRPGASSSIVAIEDAVTVGCRFTGLARRVPERDALGRAGRRGEQDVGVAPPELRVGLERRVPAERLGAPHVGGERVHGARVEPVQTEAGDLQ